MTVFVLPWVLSCCFGRCDVLRAAGVFICNSPDLISQEITGGMVLFLVCVLCFILAFNDLTVQRGVLWPGKGPSAVLAFVRFKIRNA